MKNVLIVLIVLMSGLTEAQECKIDLLSLAQPDYNMVQLNRFGQGKMFKVVFSERFDTTANKDIIDNLSQWFLNKNSVISFININDIESVDDSCNYLIIGLTRNLRDLSVFGLPVDILNAKCSLGPIDISGSEDALIVINQSARCVAVIGNSYKALRSITTGRFMGLYDYYILKNNSLSYMGNLMDNKFVPGNLVDLELIRIENYMQKINNQYLEASFSCRYGLISQFQRSLDDLIDIFDDFCRRYKVNPPAQKLKFFIHSDQLEINIVSGDPKPGTTGGFVADNLIHTVGLDKELLTHEGVHFIFNFSSNSPNAFFNEGIPMSFALYLHPEQIKNDCILIQDNLEIVDLITGERWFWNGPYKNGQCLSYQISGLFVKFLIDNYGIDKLKKLYQYTELNEGFRAVYNKEIAVLAEEWKNYIMRII